MSFPARKRVSSARKMVLPPPKIADQARKMPSNAGKRTIQRNNLPISRTKLVVLREMPIAYGMKLSHCGLLSGLYGKMQRVNLHWALVDDELPASYPLILLSGVHRAGFYGLVERLPGLREGVRTAKFNAKLARAQYAGCRAKVHRWMRDINVWMRGSYQGTVWFTLVRPVPGLRRGYDLWWKAAHHALELWKSIVKNPEPGPVQWPVTLGNGGTVEQFAEVIRAFEAAREGLRPAEMDLKLAQSVLRRTRAEGAALLMAYGHGVRARLGEDGALVRKIPQLWPRHSTKPRSKRGAVGL